MHAHFAWPIKYCFLHPCKYYTIDGYYTITFYCLLPLEELLVTIQILTPCITLSLLWGQLMRWGWGYNIYLVVLSIQLVNTLYRLKKHILCMIHQCCQLRGEMELVVSSRQASENILARVTGNLTCFVGCNGSHKIASLQCNSTQPFDRVGIYTFQLQVLSSFNGTIYRCDDKVLPG